MKKDHFEDLDSHRLTKPRNEAWGNWAKFEEKGDSVAGYIRDVFFKKAEGLYPEARGLTLEQKDGTLINVSIKRHDFVLREFDDLRLGDILKIELSELKKSSTKGFNPTKVFKFYGKKLPENDANKTVKQLDDDDRGLGGTSRSEIEKEGSEEAPKDETEGVPFP